MAILSLGKTSSILKDGIAYEIPNRRVGFTSGSFLNFCLFSRFLGLLVCYVYSTYLSMQCTRYTGVILVDFLILCLLEFVGLGDTE